MDRKHCDWCDLLLLEAKTRNPASRNTLAYEDAAATHGAVNEIMVTAPFPSETMPANYKEVALVLCAPCNAKFWLFLEVQGNVPLMTEEAIAKRAEETDAKH